ncbi:DUF5522 domain-containing protein [Pseudoalteromonas ulvae]|uniref:DUF5522 domain-containing protein n=1 Tax=Pseudoalteromonas ulvae TaxID=107327 RepID=UPI00186B7113|nr:DUF5522 domain-containing protein [Pseudoalteromonas ulvae]
MPTQCALCQAPLSCSADQQCWCMTLPNILPLDSHNTCLCQSCLLTKINHFLSEQYRSQPLDRLISLAAPYQATPAIAGLDFSIVQGKYMFHRWAHLKRGYCCGNGCQECPWRTDNLNDPPLYL